MKNVINVISIAILSIFFLSSCVSVKQGNIAVKRSLGKIDDKGYSPGPLWFNPFVSQVLVIPINTQNLEVQLALPSKEGLNVNTEISILYHVKEDKVFDVISSIGKDYEEIIILPVFRASAADVTANFMAKDMHTRFRLDIEKAIRAKMMELLGDRGFEIEAVLLKSVKLPAGLYRAIEEKLEAEQDAQRMEFVLQKEKQEAKRKTIEAGGIRDANKIISEGLTPAIIQYQSIEAYRSLSNSPNAKLIIGQNLQQPLLLQP
jgi:prohibitin 1